MRAEQKTAALVYAKYGLSVPVDVEGLLRQLADVETDVLPVNCDAVVLTCNPRRAKPLVILNQSSSSARARFTVAHELGHLLIPWHMGTFACHTQWGIRLGNQLYSSVEAESNRFASEILVPSAWLANVVESGLSPARMLTFIRQTATVSTAVAMLALIQALPAGYLFAQTDAAGFVNMASSSPGSLVLIPVKRSLLDISLYSASCTLYETVSMPYGEIMHLWRYVSMGSAQITFDSRTSGEILKAIIASAVFTEEQAKALIWSINGIIGAANGSRKPKTVEQLLAVLHETFTVRRELVAVTSHSDFDVFLMKRAKEIVARKPV